MKEPIAVKNEAVELELNDAQIQEWKNQWGRVFQTIVNGEPYVWRKLKRREYVEIMSEASEVEDDYASGLKVYQRQERIAKLVTLYPANIEEHVENNAGLATCISDEVINKSGFNVAGTDEL